MFLQLGLVIDLTNTNRYYPESDWLDSGIKYAKVRILEKIIFLQS